MCIISIEMNVFNSLQINIKNVYIILGSVIISEVSYRLFKKLYSKKRRKHQVLFFTGANNTPWRTHAKEQCFNLNCYCHNFHTIKNYINNTKYTLNLCMNIFTSEEIAQTVIDAHLRGIKVRIITDFEMSHSSGSKMKQFQSYGIQVRFKNSTNCSMHHKFCLFDVDTENGVLMTGSLNLTMQAVAGNWDNVIFTTQSDLIQEFTYEFNRIWNSFE